MAKTIKKGKPYPGIDLDDFYSQAAEDKIEYVAKGISKKDLVTIKQEADLDYESLSRILAVSRAKLLQKKPAEKFDRTTSEKILLLADLVGFGYKVFEDKPAFNTWLRTSNLALGGKTPLHMMDTFYGSQEVKNLIGRIEYGIF